jgi:23S rRNA (pseudouridine1915-N3)-methyltransferase
LPAVPERLEILAVGGLDGGLRPVFEHYRRLIGGLARLEVREVRETALRGRAPAEVLRDEGRRLTAALPAAGTVVALDAGGRLYDSEAFAERLRAWCARGVATFVVGGSLGLADDVKQAATETLSLSPLTMPHQLARVVLAEQLFRALKIAHGETYHH